MPGIVGYAGRKQAALVVLEGLRRLEYGGYDHAALAVGSSRRIHFRQASGTLRNLETSVRLNPVRGTTGIGQIRWSRRAQLWASPERHGNAEHLSVRVAVDGSPGTLDTLWEQIPNGASQREATPASDALALLVQTIRRRGEPLEEAVRRAARHVDGICTFAAIAADDPGKIVAVRLGRPAVVGLGMQENFVASDKPPILRHTREMIQLENGDLAVVTVRGVVVMDGRGRRVSRTVHHVLWDPMMAEKSGYQHFVLKEIYEQPRAIRDTALGRIDEGTGRVVLDELGVTLPELRQIRHLNVIGSGSSWHAALLAKSAVERLARVHVNVAVSSEFRYSDPVIDEQVLTLVVSKSGETADTLAAQQLAHELGSGSIAICNAADSTMAHNARGAIHTNAGPELAAVSTKGFTAQLAAFYLFAMYLGQARGTLDAKQSKLRARDILDLPRLVERALELAGQCERLANQLAHAGKALYLGRGVHFPIALQAARMLSELAHVPAEACPAGELPQTPAALIDPGMPVVVLATVDRQLPSSRLRYERTLAQVRDLTSQRGWVICIAGEDDDIVGDYAHEVVRVPTMCEPLQAAVSHIPLQLLAYYTGVQRGCDVDHPRDVGRSVTTT